MAEQTNKQEAKILLVSSSPHLTDSGTSRRIMIEVAVAMVLPVAMSIYLFRTPAAIVLVSSVAACMATEAIFNAVRKKPQTVFDWSVIVTGLILGLSLPPSLPWWVVVIGAIVAVGVGKMVFGGLGNNIFNPAMVGRAFLMACFGMMMTSWTMTAQQQQQAGPDAVTQATPLARAKTIIDMAAKKTAEEPAAAMTAATEQYAEQEEKPDPLEELNGQWKDMFMGNISGSLGETSALCWLLGGLFLLVRRTITVHLPLAVLGSAAAIAAIAWWANPEVYPNPMVHLTGGGLVMCAFFIATDPVTCPLSKLGRVIFGIGVGALTMLIRLVGGYPEGVMYAVLLMNSLTPLLDRWTRPTPLGGHASAS